MRCLITWAYIFLDNVTVVFISPNADSICIHINQGIVCCMYVLAPILPRIFVFILIKTSQGTNNTLWHDPSRVSHTKFVYFREMKCRNAVCYGFWIISSCIFSKWSFWESETFTSCPLFEIYDGEDGTKETTCHVRHDKNWFTAVFNELHSYVRSRFLPDKGHSLLETGNVEWAVRLMHNCVTIPNCKSPFLLKMKQFQSQHVQYFQPDPWYALAFWLKRIAHVVVVILFPTEYKQCITAYMNNNIKNKTT